MKDTIKEENMEDTLAILKAIKKHLNRMGADATYDVLGIAVKICEAMPACYHDKIVAAAFEEEKGC